MAPARVLISAAHKSSGKTTLSIGLCAALSKAGCAVQPFKKGPDYIDPMWLSLASGRPCFNLDFYLTPPAEIAALFGKHAEGADLSLIEGNKGLYDGLDLKGSNSNAALARLLGAPVVLVLDARGTIRGVAPLVLGYQAFDPEIRIGGVILNRVGGARHEQKLRAVIEHYTDVPVLGAVHENARLAIEERHLGLMPSGEAETAAATVEEVGHMVASQVDLDRLLEAAREAPPMARVPAPGALRPPVARLRIGILRDRAFGFYYADDLERLTDGGAELVPIDALCDAELPAIDGLICGGGFPEVFIGELEANVALRTALKRAIEGGLPVYAECGGLMYLSRSITWRDNRGEMVGVIPGDVVMHDKPQGRGYVRLRETGQGPWSSVDPDAQGVVCGHEFHYSGLENLGEVGFAYDVERGFGVDGRHDGVLVHNVFASYAHLRSVGGVHWTQSFLSFVERTRVGASFTTQAAAGSATR
ncbi:MAG: hydrogenobyrinic acid a,c-diamide synthase (glutamine-hydrolyzing) [Betaproteobacteria bacterium]|nr:hydrogenobyrinic acid a,c-diamide synthase (glutamine-hydrolyzing) [Betaproteobacteria bacterium]